jgi:predicted nucleic acid-binding protein
MQHRAAVFTTDKDFARIARLTSLPLHPLPNP